MKKKIISLIIMATMAVSTATVLFAAENNTADRYGGLYS